MIELINISKTFEVKNKFTKALDQVTLRIPDGEIFGVIGTSGAGKSTLIRCVNLLEKPDEGQILIHGVELTALSHQNLIQQRRKIGMIFQHFNLLSSRTVYQNIAFPLELIGTSKQKINEKVKELLSLVGLEDKANDYPANLSGGQKQRVAIARALANDPEILLCDEATSALDPATTKSILQLLKAINKKLKLTILLITHEMEVIKTICDQVAVIDQGKLIETGTIEQIFTSPKEHLTRHFIQSSLHAELPPIYQERLKESGHPLVQIYLAESEHQTSIIKHLNQAYHLDINIISAQIDYVGSIKFGILNLELKGTQEDTLAGLTYLKSNYSQIEIIGYV
ncbi:methionine ABC transporter ATP-binding protein [Sphingobacterium sp. SRCM116780]|uniref:methionine ABC transporter ATP-binding protein n=1 Tax=Sphingobacterium sp. SRCM116780 TaxID=2907623 RepID=UPI001F333FE3|nr:methionine ABC transporter ATP-binding protein [Sphingobacterium sp. SRCM116780]UIR54486.1 methionine ABC transporter ATP-binding protein [Sphingobacterium sp. SRCM116780]